jgi:hypothetical protein
MAYELRTAAGVLCIVRTGQCWTAQLNGRRWGKWRLPDDAAHAVARQFSVLSERDTQQLDVPDDLLDWTPLGESL